MLSKYKEIDKFVMVVVVFKSLDTWNSEADQSISFNERCQC